jgi:transposase
MLRVAVESAVKPQPRPLADEQVRKLSAVLLRRRQILAMTTAEGNRARTAPKALRKRIEAHLRQQRGVLARRTVTSASSEQVVSDELQ